MSTKFLIYKELQSIDKGLLLHVKIQMVVTRTSRNVLQAGLGTFVMKYHFSLKR
jgi:hypothetical protein